jgi:hypothetical protein
LPFFSAFAAILTEGLAMAGDAPEAIVLVWIKNGEHPDSPGVNLDQTEHFSRLDDALRATRDLSRYPRDKAPWIKAQGTWMTPEQIRRSDQ